MMNTHTRALARPKLSLRYGAGHSPARQERTPAKPAIPALELQRLVAAMVD
jgi:hypothetical protein